MSFAEWVEKKPRWARWVIWTLFALLLAAWFLPPVIGLLMMEG